MSASTPDDQLLARAFQRLSIAHSPEARMLVVSEIIKLSPWLGPYFQALLQQETSPMTRLVDDVDDFLQELMLKLFRTQARFAGTTDAEARAYLKTTAGNLFRDRLKKARRQSRLIQPLLNFIRGNRTWRDRLGHNHSSDDRA